MQTASNEPSPIGIGPRVTTIDARMNALKAPLNGTWIPSAKRQNCIVSPSSAKTAPLSKASSAVRRSLRTEIVPYGAYEAEGMAPPVEADPVQIPVERPPKRPAPPAGRS